MKKKDKMISQEETEAKVKALNERLFVELDLPKEFAVWEVYKSPVDDDLGSIRMTYSTIVTEEDQDEYFDAQAEVLTGVDALEAENIDQWVKDLAESDLEYVRRTSIGRVVKDEFEPWELPEPTYDKKIPYPIGKAMPLSEFLDNEKVNREFNKNLRVYRESLLRAKDVDES